MKIEIKLTRYTRNLRATKIMIKNNYWFIADHHRPIEILYESWNYKITCLLWLIPSIPDQSNRIQFLIPPSIRSCQLQLNIPAYLYDPERFLSLSPLLSTVHRIYWAIGYRKALIKCSIIIKSLLAGRWSVELTAIHLYLSAMLQLPAAVAI